MIDRTAGDVMLGNGYLVLVVGDVTEVVGRRDLYFATLETNGSTRTIRHGSPFDTYMRRKCEGSRARKTVEQQAR